MTTTENPALAIMGLTKRFGTTTLWSALTFDAFPGTLTAVSGPSGAGKTTLLNCVGLLEDFDEGTVSYGARIFAPGYLRTSGSNSGYACATPWDSSFRTTVSSSSGTYCAICRCRWGLAIGNIGISGERGSAWCWPGSA